MCRRIAWSWSIITKGILIVVSSDTTVAVIEVLLVIEYRLIKGLRLLEVAASRLGACSINTLLVCVVGLLLSSAAAVVLFVANIFLVQKFELVPSIAFTACCPYNQTRNER